MAQNREQESRSSLYRLGKVTFADIWTRNRRMREQLVKARRLAGATSYEANVLILGESGTGKNLLAQAIHNASRRRERAFVPVNLGAVPDNLLCADLFGSEEGAFTQAKSRKGYFEAAHEGTLFLDEISSLAPEGQTALLEVVEHRTVTRLGSTEARPCDVRLIAATNADLAAAIADGTFRQDLYWRISRIEIQLPPLRERQEDIPWLAERFLQRACGQVKRQLNGFSDECLALMQDYAWPGNVRELRNVVERAVYHCTGSTVEAEHMFPGLVDDGQRGQESPMDLSLAAVERRHIAKVLTLTGWNKTRTADMLGIGRTALYDKIKRYGLRPDSGT